jgi:hypothetical protein
MSRLTSKEVKNIMEAYGAMYAPQELTEEQVWEEVENWVNSLLEEGYDLSEYTWEEMYESYLEEVWGTKPGSYKPSGLDKAMSNVPKALGFGSSPNRTGQVYAGPGVGWVKKPVASSAKPPSKPQLSNIPPQEGTGKGAPGAGVSPSPGKGAGGGGGGRRAPAPTSSAPASSTAAKPAPSAPAAQTGDKAKDTATWASANPKLAAASAERDRTRGTSATTNPLMKDFKSRLPAPKTPSPSTAAKGFELASKGVNLSKPSAPTPAVPAASKPAAPSPKRTPAATGSRKPGSIVSSFDPFDVVIGHLLDEGYADTEESALAIMANMSEEWRNSIVEETLTEKLKKGTKGVQFGSGRHSGGWEQAMTEKNPKTGRQRATSPMYKAMGAHGKARSAQAKAESDGDFPRAEKNRQRREKIAATVYRKTGKIIDRADND